MSSVVLTTLLAALAFAAFHVPLPRRRGGRWDLAPLHGRVAGIFGVAYHLLLLPAVTALPAPSWAVAAGLGWMVLDAVLDGAWLAGATFDARPLRDGVHLVAGVWLVAAGWTHGPGLGLAGSALTLAFVARLALDGTEQPTPAWLLRVNALLNMLWMLGVAAALA